MPNYAYKGRDRRMIKKLQLCLTSILKRDQRALDATPTASLSTRLPILDYINIAGGLMNAANLLLVACSSDLAANNSLLNNFRSRRLRGELNTPPQQP